MPNGALHDGRRAVWTDPPVVPEDDNRLTSLQSRLAVRNRPNRRVAMYHSWRDLLFLHWRTDAAAVQASLPTGLTVDTFEGQAWIGLVPFFMRNIRPWWLPSLPGLSNFQELNCRTYVIDAHGTPGVWFYSLDANSRLTVWGARAFYHLPYHLARMTYECDEERSRVDFRSHRRGIPRHAASRFVYEPREEPSVCTPGTLEFFLIERYVLFAKRHDGELFYGQVHHAPYAVSPANVEVCDDSLLDLNGFHRTGRPPDHALFSRGVDVVVFPLTPVGR
ncbi:MAG: YqjF family protein [Planctomycetaceae bacterium]